MDRLQYVYSSSETSDEELESADTVLSPKGSSKAVSGSSQKTDDILGYTPARHNSGSPTETRSSSEKRHSPDSFKGRSDSRGRSPESRKDRHSPSYRRRSKERRRSRDKDRDRDRSRDHRRRHKSRERSKDRRRDRSRERRYDRRSRSRSPRRSHRDSPKRSKDRSRSPPPRKHFDPKNKLYILNRMGIDYKGTESVDSPNKQLAAGGTSSTSANPAVPQYYNPLTINAGKYAEQIAKRKMLWNSKKTETPKAETGNIWQGAKFSQDSDGKMAAKFQRLMGMKDAAPPGTGKGQELIKKQEELFSTMEMQYEVARATTHTQRGVGLGFGPRHIP